MKSENEVLREGINLIAYHLHTDFNTDIDRIKDKICNYTIPRILKAAEIAREMDSNIKINEITKLELMGLQDIVNQMLEMVSRDENIHGSVVEEKDVGEYIDLRRSLKLDNCQKLLLFRFIEKRLDFN